MKWVHFIDFFITILKKKNGCPNCTSITSQLVKIHLQQRTKNIQINFLDHELIQNPANLPLRHQCGVFLLQGFFDLPGQPEVMVGREAFIGEELTFANGRIV